jgi:hypothetical protein
MPKSRRPLTSPIYSLDDGIRELIKGYTMIRNTRYGNVKGLIEVPEPQAVKEKRK